MTPRAATPATAFVPTASLPGIAWPAVPAGGQAVMLAVLDQLGQSQWWPPELMRRQQRRQLAALLAHARRTVPFYRDRLAGVDAGLTADSWARIPVLTRRDLQEAGAALDSTAVPPEHGAVDVVRSSGSTGTPVAVKRTQMATLFWQAMVLRDHLWHGRDLGTRLAMIRVDEHGRAPAPDGVALPNWGSPTAEFFATGPAAMLTAAAPVAVQAAWLARQRADYLLALPTNLAFLARHCRDRGPALRFRAITTIGSPVGPELRALCREVFDAAIDDVYSTSETGTIALQCPAANARGPHYHVMAEDALVEILDEAGRECAPGAVGRVVVTPLHAFATPLIRYAIGDHAEAGPPCGCGRGLPVIARILGRTRNMLRRASGAPVFPAFSLTALAELPPVVQWQAVQSVPGRLDVRLAVRRPLTGAEEDRARALIAAAVGPELAIALVYCAEIARAANGKFEEFRSELPDMVP